MTDRTEERIHDPAEDDNECTAIDTIQAPTSAAECLG
jgi:hypothetical protein